jgi:hypothetical protein
MMNNNNRVAWGPRSWEESLKGCLGRLGSILGYFPLF